MVHFGLCLFFVFVFVLLCNSLIFSTLTEWEVPLLCGNCRVREMVLGTEFKVLGGCGFQRSSFQLAWMQMVQEPSCLANSPPCFNFQRRLQGMREPRIGKCLGAVIV